MRVRLAIAALLAALILSGCGSGAHVWTQGLGRATRFARINPDHAVLLRWSGISIANRIGYYVYCSRGSHIDCPGQSSTQVASTLASPYTVANLACGTTYTLGVAAHDAASPTPNTSSVHSTSYSTPACGRASASCSGSELCVSLPETSTSFAGNELSTQDVYTFGSWEKPPAGGSPTIWQRLQALSSAGWRQVGYPAYRYSQTEISPVNYYAGSSDSNGYHLAWDFRSADRELSLAPPTATRDFGMQWPESIFHCPSGSWTSASGCAEGGPAGFADQSYSAMASLYAGVVRYFRTDMTASGSGSGVTYTANSVTDTSGALARTAGDCITAEVIDSYGSADWVTGTISSVTGNTATLTANWSTAESWETYAPVGTIPSSTPAAGAAYNVASCTPPGVLAGGSGAHAAQPWPRPPSVGNVQNYELGNEPDDGGSGLPFTVPSLPAPAPRLTGVNVGGGTLTSGVTYQYEIAAAGGEGNGADLYGGGGGLSKPGTQESITLPGGDNAVRITWNNTSDTGLTPYSYVIYGRTSGSQLGLAAIGRDAVRPNASSFSWTDNGAITPAGAPNATDQSGGGWVITPGSYVSLWDAVAPAMKAVDPTIRVMGPVTANPGTYSSSYVDSRCVTTNGLNSACANGDSNWSPTGTFEQALLALGNPRPDILTFHAYGTVFSDAQNPESSNFASVNGYEISHYNSAVKSLVDAAHIPIWITENNYNAGSSAAGGSTHSYSQMLQLGSAWLAYNLIEWTDDEPRVQQLIQWNINADTGDMFFEGYASGDTSTDCVPQPACAHLTQGEPGLNYWTIYEISRLMTAGKLVSVSNVPSGFAALAVKTDSTHVVVLVVNIQQGADNGNGASGTPAVQLQGASVTDAQDTTINGATNMTSGPSTADLGAESNVPISSAGYEVDLIKFTLR